LQAGTFEEGARHEPPYRGAVANAVYNTVRNSMKGQPESLVERAIIQAQRQTDLLYLLVVKANVEVIGGKEQRGREYLFLLGYLSAEMNGRITKERVENLRRAALIFIEPVIVLDAAIAQLVAQRLTGQPVLFRDSAVMLAEQLQMANHLSGWFNKLAVEVGVAEINLEELRNSLQSETQQRLSIWVNLARVEMLIIFGKTEETQAALDQCFRLCGPKSDEVKHAVLG